jgi:hypothetical protein
MLQSTEHHVPFIVANAYCSATACAAVSSAVKAAANQSTNQIATENATEYANTIKMQQVDTTLAHITGGVSCGVPGQGQHLHHTGSRRIDRVAARTSVPSGSGGRRAHGNATQVINRSHASSSFKALAACVAASCSTAACEAASASCHVTSRAIVSLAKAANAGDKS